MKTATTKMMKSTAQQIASEHIEWWIDNIMWYVLPINVYDAYSFSIVAYGFSFFSLFFPSSIFAAVYAEEMCVYQPMPSAIWSPFVRALLVHSITDTHTHSYTHPHALLSHLIDDSRWILRLNWKWPIFGHADEPNLPLGFISLPDNISEI